MGLQPKRRCQFVAAGRLLRAGRTILCDTITTSGAELRGEPSNAKAECQEPYNTSRLNGSNVGLDRCLGAGSKRLQ